ncbi:Sec-independent protein translocase subunit TatA [Streptomyces gilvosporeus]|uniref:Sec-independent protein translocase protein TatA n=1 Tax=Streptomyces gilvosporeus TaxID=553510 RepID=A0A1V0TZP4_9ACTN|nr:Sec-independent protein translocase subunit TatA [Streptomyces gilvosporeus]ARF58383.1 Sec-independent protein translocase TatA [Streptomyces gilvosporeus]
MLRNGLEPWHLLVVAIVVILLFGSKKLPDTARALGKSLRILKSETKAMKDDGTPPTTTYEPGPQPQSEPGPRTLHTAPGGPATGRAEPVRPESEAMSAPSSTQAGPGTPR